MADNHILWNSKSTYSDTSCISSTSIRNKILNECNVSHPDKITKIDIRFNKATFNQNITGINIDSKSIHHMHTHYLRAFRICIEHNIL